MSWKCKPNQFTRLENIDTAKFDLRAGIKLSGWEISHNIFISRREGENQIRLYLIPQSTDIKLGASHIQHINWVFIKLKLILCQSTKIESWEWIYVHLFYLQRRNLPPPTLPRSPCAHTDCTFPCPSILGLLTLTEPVTAHPSTVSSHWQNPSLPTNPRSPHTDGTCHCLYQSTVSIHGRKLHMIRKFAAKKTDLHF